MAKPTKPIIKIVVAPPRNQAEARQQIGKLLDKNAAAMQALARL